MKSFYETQVINGIPYERNMWDDGTGSIWRPVGSRVDAPLVCSCGSTEFHIIYTDNYETTAECVKCKTRDVVHSG